MKIKILYNKILWELGVRKILPAYYINKIEINDCGEKLVEFQSVFIRESIAIKLNKVQKFLPNGIRLKVVEGFRADERQKEMWLKEYRKNKKNNPGINENELERLTSLKIAKFGKSGGAHQTGGAIDLTLIDDNGLELNMGTAVVEFNSKTETFSKDLSQKEKNNRKILIKAMEREGFNNYPAEWWHWSYGDRMWAAYQKKPFAIYGSIKKEV